MLTQRYIELQTKRLWHHLTSHEDDLVIHFEYLEARREYIMRALSASRCAVVYVEFGTKDLLRTMDDFSQTLIEPRLEQLANTMQLRHDS